MAWFNRLLSHEKLLPCFLIAALFAVPMSLAFILMGKANIGVVIVVVLTGLTLSSRLIEKTLTNSFAEISSVSAKIAKGDFTFQVEEVGA